MKSMVKRVEALEQRVAWLERQASVRIAQKRAYTRKRDPERISRCREDIEKYLRLHGARPSSQVLGALMNMGYSRSMIYIAKAGVDNLRIYRNRSKWYWTVGAMPLAHQVALL